VALSPEQTSLTYLGIVAQSGKWRVVALVDPRPCFVLFFPLQGSGVVRSYVDFDTSASLAQFVCVKYIRRAPKGFVQALLALPLSPDDALQGVTK